MGNESSVVIVSGSPGSGKTTLCRAAATQRPDGLHLVSDRFYEFLPHLIDPATSASRLQNETLMRALGACTAQFGAAGYAVFLDGVIGPWMLPLLRPFLQPIGRTQYVVLQLPLEDALARVTERQGPGLSGTVRAMHAKFENLGPFAAHGLDVTGRDPDAILQELDARLADDAYALDWSLTGA